GLIGNTIYHYPVGLTVFSTTNELEFNDGDLKPASEKPTREELLSYYVRFVLDNELNIHTEETVIEVKHDFLSVSSVGSSLTENLTTENTERTEKDRSFFIKTNKAEYASKNILFAIGAMDYPRKLNVPGEDLPKVRDHFHETYPWVKKKALIVGGGNSAGEAALFLAEEGADTTLAIFRGDWENNDPKQGCIKYWVKQPLEEELKKHCLKLFFLGMVVEVTEKTIVLEDENGETDVLENDVVFVLIGSDADLTMLKDLGVTTEKAKYGEIPVYNSETFETAVPGIYVAGHFTNDRHIKPAIEAPRKIIPVIASRLAAKKG
ncbi:MAG TPA: NAD(P)-binding domain-containing protein, partial [Pyrinomonadaceae bacterium]|nr:NAD(P)-binding domain-containing protein [Pyrinomonadaceae bacterium]